MDDDAPAGFCVVPLPENYMCSVCLEPLIEAANLSPCNHKVCMRDATRIPRCPVCRQQVIIFGKDHTFSDVVSQYCAKREFHCELCAVRVVGADEAARHICPAREDDIFERLFPLVDGKLTENVVRLTIRSAITNGATADEDIAERLLAEVSISPVTEVMAEHSDTSRYPDTRTLAQTIISTGITYRDAPARLLPRGPDTRPTNSYAWHNMGNTMTATERATVLGREMGPRDCHLEAVTHDPRFHERLARPGRHDDRNRACDGERAVKPSTVAAAPGDTTAAPGRQANPLGLGVAAAAPAVKPSTVAAAPRSS